MLSSTLKSASTGFSYSPHLHPRTRPVGSNTDHQQRLRQAQAQRKESSIHNGKIVTVSAAHDSFCSSIGDLTFDGEGSSRHCLSLVASLSDTTTSQASHSPADNPSRCSRARDRWSTTQECPVVLPPNLPRVTLRDNPAADEVEITVSRSASSTKSDDIKLGKQAQGIMIPLSSRWSCPQDKRDGVEKKSTVKPIQRFASLSPVKRLRSKERVSQSLRPREIEGTEQRKTGIELNRVVTGARSRSEGEVATSLEKPHTIQRNRSAGDRAFQFLQRMRPKSKNSEIREIRAMAHACEADKMMNQIAGNDESQPLTSNVPGKAKIPSVIRRPTPLLRKQRSKSAIGSLELLEMAHCVTPFVTRRRSLQGTRQGCTFETNEQTQDISNTRERDVFQSPRRKHSHLKKQRSKSLLCSHDMSALECDLQEIPRFARSPSPNNSYTVGLSAPPNAARRTVSMTAIDSPPRRPRRQHPGRAPPPSMTKSFDGYLARQNEEDWRIASLEEDSTHASTGRNQENVCPLSKQEDEMILFALERSLEDSGAAPSPSYSPTITSPTIDDSCPQDDGSQLFWVKEKSGAWVALPGVSFKNDDSTAENEMLERVLKSSVKETFRLVLLQIVGVKRLSASPLEGTLS